MKTIESIKDHLKSLKDVFHFDLLNIEQGSDEWRQIKLGVISASNISKVLAKKGTQTRLTYMTELVAQIATREMPEIKAAPLEWGKTNELAARSIYEFETGNKIEEVPFIFGDDTLRFGCSPDGYLADRGLELKCPFTSKVFIEFLCADKIKKEYIQQCQYSMWVTGAAKWDFANYDPRMGKTQFHRVELERDEKQMKIFDEVVPEFISDMDKMLTHIGIEFGYQWHTKINKAA